MSDFSKVQEACKEFIKVEHSTKAKKNGVWKEKKLAFTVAFRRYLDSQVSIAKIVSEVAKTIK